MHSKEYGALTETAYLKRERALRDSDIGGYIKGFASSDGWKFRYNMITNELLTAKPDGTIETLMRPNRGFACWQEQVVKYLDRFVAQ